MGIIRKVNGKMNTRSVDEFSAGMGEFVCGGICAAIALYRGYCLLEPLNDVVDVIKAGIGTPESCLQCVDILPWLLDDRPM